MRETLRICLMLFLGFLIATIAEAFFFLNAALPVINKSLGAALQTALLDEFVVLVIFLFMAVIFVCSTTLGAGPGGLLLVYGLFSMFEIMKDLLDRLP